MNCQLSGIWSVLAAVTGTRGFVNQPHLGSTDDPSISCLLLDSITFDLSFLGPVLTFGCSNDSFDKDQAENHKEKQFTPWNSPCRSSILRPPIPLISTGLLS